jgi:hypothetical protein
MRATQRGQDQKITESSACIWRSAWAAPMQRKHHTNKGTPYTKATVPGNDESTTHFTFPPPKCFQQDIVRSLVVSFAAFSKVMVTFPFLYCRLSIFYGHLFPSYLSTLHAPSSISLSLSCLSSSRRLLLLFLPWGSFPLFHPFCFSFFVAFNCRLVGCSCRIVAVCSCMPYTIIASSKFKKY